MSTPDCTIIDYSVGLPGSAHDASAWKETRLAQQHDHLLQPGEWVWADTAYPLSSWCQCAYKKYVQSRYIAAYQFTLILPADLSGMCQKMQDTTTTLPEFAYALSTALDTSKVVGPRCDTSALRLGLRRRCATPAYG